MNAALKGAGIGVMGVSAPMFVASIWTGDDRWYGTALVCLITGFVALCAGWAA